MEREIIGSFTVLSWEREQRRVVVSQKSVSHYKKETTPNGKYMNLDQIDGPEVFKTKDSNIFRLFDGTELRRLGCRR